MNFRYLLKLLMDLNPKVIFGIDDKNDPDYGKAIYASIPGQFLVMPREFYYNPFTNEICNTRKHSPINHIKVEDIYEYMELSARDLAYKLCELNPDIDNIRYYEKDNSLSGDGDISELSLPMGFTTVEGNKLTNLYNEYSYTNTRLKKVVSSKEVYSKGKEKRH
jgi:hypothetical protein